MELRRVWFSSVSKIKVGVSEHHNLLPKAHMCASEYFEHWNVKIRMLNIFKWNKIYRYIGEIITDFEADQREDDSYLFDLDNKVVAK